MKRIILISSTAISISLIAARPMFGSRTNEWTECGGSYYDAGSGNCVRGCQDMKQKTTYVFWIGFPGDEEVVQSYTVAAEGC